MLAWLRRRSYRESTIRNFVVRAGRLCRWLQQRCGPALENLSQSDLCAAYDYFRDPRIEVACVSRVLGLFLAEQQLLRAEHGKPLSHAERQIKSFSTYLRDVRGLTATTISGHCRRIGAFLRFLKVEEQPLAIRQLSHGQIDAFLCQAAKASNRISMQQIVASLRILLRELHAEGLLPRPTPPPQWPATPVARKPCAPLRVVRNFLLFHARRAPDTYIPDLKTFPGPSPRRSPRLVSVTEMAQLTRRRRRVTSFSP